MTKNRAVVNNIMDPLTAVVDAVAFSRAHRQKLVALAQSPQPSNDDDGDPALAASMCSMTCGAGLTLSSVMLAESLRTRRSDCTCLQTRKCPLLLIITAHGEHFTHDQLLGAVGQGRAREVRLGRGFHGRAESNNSWCSSSLLRTNWGSRHGPSQDSKDMCGG